MRKDSYRGLSNDVEVARAWSGGPYPVACETALSV